MYSMSMACTECKRQNYTTKKNSRTILIKSLS